MLLKLSINHQNYAKFAPTVKVLNQDGVYERLPESAYVEEVFGPYRKAKLPERNKAGDLMTVGARKKITLDTFDTPTENLTGPQRTAIRQANRARVDSRVRNRKEMHGSRGVAAIDYLTDPATAPSNDLLKKARAAATTDPSVAAELRGDLPQLRKLARESRAVADSVRRNSNVGKGAPPGFTPGGAASRRADMYNVAYQRAKAIESGQATVDNVADRAPGLPPRTPPPSPPAGLLGDIPDPWLSPEDVPAPTQMSLPLDEVVPDEVQKIIDKPAVPTQGMRQQVTAAAQQQIEAGKAAASDAVEAGKAVASNAVDAGKAAAMDTIDRGRGAVAGVGEAIGQGVGGMRDSIGRGLGSATSAVGGWMGKHPILMAGGAGLLGLTAIAGVGSSLADRDEEARIRRQRELQAVSDYGY